MRAEDKDGHAESYGHRGQAQATFLDWQYAADSTSHDVYRQWFDYPHPSMLVDLCGESLV